VALLYSIRPGPWPVAWAVATVGIELLWVVVLRHYSRHVLHASPAERVAFVRRLRPLWRLNGALWGASLLIFAGAPVSMNLLACWLILGCFGAIVSNAMAPHRPSLMAYLNGFAGAMLASYAIDMWLARDLALVNGALLLLMLLYWFLLAYIGRGQHALLQRAMLLQQRNALLVDSLQRAQCWRCRGRWTRGGAFWPWPRTTSASRCTRCGCTPTCCSRTRARWTTWRRASSSPAPPSTACSTTCSTWRCWTGAACTRCRSRCACTNC